MNLECQTCGASLLVDPNQRTATCPYCASPQVMERPPQMDRPAPHFGVGFTMTKEGAQGSVKEWLGRRSFFVQSGVKGGTVDSIKGVYTPAYLYSAMATSQYSAQIGEDYQETETYTTTDSNGNTVVRTRTVTKTEWRYLQGQHSQYVMDVLVTGSRVIPNPELEAIEPFDAGDFVLREVELFEGGQVLQVLDFRDLVRLPSAAATLSPSSWMWRTWKRFSILAMRFLFR